MATEQTTSAPVATPPPAAPSSKLDIMGLVSLILGVIAMGTAWLQPIVSIVAGVVAIVLAIIGMNNVKKTGGSKALALAGLICGILGALGGASVLILTLTLWNTTINLFENLSETMNSY